MNLVQTDSLPLPGAMDASKFEVCPALKQPISSHFSTALTAFNQQPSQLNQLPNSSAEFIRRNSNLNPQCVFHAPLRLAVPVLTEQVRYFLFLAVSIFKLKESAN